MSRNLYPIILSLMLSACSSSDNGLKKIVTTKIEAMNRHDLEALGDLYADSSKIESVGFEKVERGPEGIRGAYKRYYASSPDLTFELMEVTYGENSAVIEYIYGGTMQQSPLEAVIPAYMIGKKYKLKTATRIEVKAGKIINEMTYFDQLSFLRQMGYFEQNNNQ